jgi:hypothetical protein
MKRLEAGTFRRLANDSGQEVLELEFAELMMLLEGIDAGAITRRLRYQDQHRQQGGMLTV